MHDFRQSLYKSYVSAFKKEEREQLAAADGAFFRYWDYKYRPIFSSWPRTAEILELGCGPGRMLRYLRSLGFSQVKGIDISAEQIELAQASGTDAEGADVFDFLRSVDEPYAAVIALDFLEHFTKDELMALVPLIHGALGEGGSLVIQTPNGEGLFPNQVVYGDLTHSTIFTPSSLSQLLSVMGFGGLRFFEAGPVPKNLTGLARTALWKALKALANGVRIIEANKRQDLWTENMICVCSRDADPRETGR